MRSDHQKYGVPFIQKGIRTEFDDLDSANKYYDEQFNLIKNAGRNPNYFTEIFIEKVIDGRTTDQLRYTLFGR